MKFALAISSLLSLAAFAVAAPQGCDPHAKSLPPTQHFPFGNGTGIDFPCKPGQENTIEFLDANGCQHPDMKVAHSIIAFGGVVPYGYLDGDHITFGCPRDGRVHVAIVWEVDEVPLKWHQVPEAH